MRLTSLNMLTGKASCRFTSSLLIPTLLSWFLLILSSYCDAPPLTRMFAQSLLLVQSRIIRQFDTHATCAVDNIEVLSFSVSLIHRQVHKLTSTFHITRLITLSLLKTADTYYRWSSCASNVKDISIPLLCISSLDDPVCTAEAIPWDECR